MQNSPLTPDEAIRLIRFILAHGRLCFSFHCQEESMPERNVTEVDVRNMLQNGCILGAPEWNDNFQQWKYRVEGEDLDGDCLTAITVIIQKDLQLVVITVF